MPIWMKHVGTRAEPIVVTQLSTGKNYTLSGEDNMVDLEVGSEGITIEYKDNRVLTITDSNFELTFTDSSTESRIVFSIISGIFLGAAKFDVERLVSHKFKITNTDKRLYNGHADHGQNPREVYHIVTQTTNSNGKHEDTWKLS